MNARLFLLLAGMASVAGCGAAPVRSDAPPERATDPGLETEPAEGAWWTQASASCDATRRRTFPLPQHVHTRTIGRGPGPNDGAWVDTLRVPELASDWVTKCPVRLSENPVNPDGKDCPLLDEILQHDHQLLVRDVNGVRRAAVYAAGGSSPLFDLAMTPVFGRNGAVAWLMNDDEDTFEYTVFIMLKEPHASNDEKYYEVELFRKGDRNCSSHMPRALNIHQHGPTAAGGGAAIGPFQTDAGGGYEPPEN